MPTYMRVTLAPTNTIVPMLQWSKATVEIECSTLTATIKMKT